MRFAIGLPRFSTQSQSSSFLRCSIMAYFGFYACPLSKDAAAYRFLQCPPGWHYASLSGYMPRQLAICTSFVPLPRESSQKNHSNTSTSVAVFQPFPLFVHARTNPSKLSATRRFCCWPVVPANAACTSLKRSLSLLSTITTSAPVVHGTGAPRYAGALHNWQNTYVPRLTPWHAPHSTRGIQSAARVAPYGSASNAPSAYRCKHTGVRGRRSCTSCCQPSFMHS